MQFFGNLNITGKRQASQQQHAESEETSEDTHGSAMEEDEEDVEHPVVQKPARTSPRNKVV